MHVQDKISKNNFLTGTCTDMFCSHNSSSLLKCPLFRGSIMFGARGGGVKKKIGGGLELIGANFRVLSI
jgi:hypothetical protein